MKIALIGYGKMGKAIESAALEQNKKAGYSKYEIVLKVDIHNRHSLTKEDLQQADVAIEFTSPETAIENIKWCFDADVPVVVGSTGWTKELKNIQLYAAENEKSFLFAPNYSIGVNIFFEINRKLAEIMNRYDEYDVVMEEIHHTEKKDAPSGTALFAAFDVLHRIQRKDQWRNYLSDNAATLSIISKREPEVPGTHSVKYTSVIDDIELIHTAHNREGFAKGALLAAEWLIGKKGYYSMEDVLGFNQ